MVETSAAAPAVKQGAFKDKEKPTEVRLSNIVAGKGMFVRRAWIHPLT